MSDADRAFQRALLAFLAERKLMLSNAPMDNIVIPLKDGGELRVPALFYADEKLIR